MRYQNADALRRAIEQRIANEVRGDQRLTLWRRRNIAFDRVIARIVHVEPEAFYLKGGLALHYRFGDIVRRTVDMDFAARSIQRMRAVLCSAIDAPIDDFFTLRIASEPTEALIEDEGVTAYRWAIDVFLADRRFERVTIDVGIDASECIGSFQRIRTQPLLAFAEIPSPEVLVIPLEQHIAEKLHAYVRSYGNAQSTRVKDLVDLVLLSRMGVELSPLTLREAIDATFTARKTPDIPSALPPPPEHWRAIYPKLSIGLNIPNEIELAHREAATMLLAALSLSPTG